MLLSAVSVLVVAQSSSEIPEGLLNNPVYTAIFQCLYLLLWQISVTSFTTATEYVTFGHYVLSKLTLQCHRSLNSNYYSGQRGFNITANLTRIHERTVHRGRMHLKIKGPYSAPMLAINGSQRHLLAHGGAAIFFFPVKLIRGPHPWKGWKPLLYSQNAQRQVTSFAVAGEGWLTDRRPFSFRSSSSLSRAKRISRSIGVSWFLQNKHISPQISR